MHGLSLSRPGLSLLAAVLAVVLAPALHAGQGRELTGAELVKLGFFQDFDELDLEALLDTGDVRASVASRHPEALEEAPGTVDVVTADDIQRTGARTLEDVLRSLPGFDVLTDNLGRARLVLRGAGAGPGGGSDNVVVLFNGHRLDEAITGRATVVNLDIPAELIRRLEVLRGPGSALYGPGALAGVVNIVTDRIEDFTGIAVSGGAGSFDTRRFSLRVGNSIRDVSISGLVSLVDHAGTRLLVPEDAQTLADRGGVRALSLAPGRTTDELRSLDTSYRIAFRDLTMGLRLKNENSGGFVGATDSLGTENDLNNRQLSLDLGYRRDLPGDASAQATLFFTQSETQQVLELLPPGYERPTPTGASRFPTGVFLQTAFNTRRFGGEVVLDKEVGGSHRLTGGAVLEREGTYGLEARGNLDFRTLTANEGLEPLSGAVRAVDRTTLGVFLQDRWEATGRVTVTAGVRVDDLSDVGSAVSPRAAVVASLPRDLTLKLLYGRAFRPPTFIEKHFDLPGAAGNPDLASTRADTVEVGLGYRGRDLRATATAYLSWVEDPIGLARPFDVLRTQPYVNLPDVRTRGLELSLRRSFGIDDALFVSFTRQEAEERATGAEAPGLAGNLASAGASLGLGEHLVVTPAARFRGASGRAPEDPRPEVEAYVVADVNVRVRNLYKTLELQGTLSNLLDTRYDDPSPLGGVPGDYPRPGRAFHFSATYRF